MTDREKVIKWFEYDYLPRVGAYRKDCKQGCDACVPMHDGDDYCDIDMLCKVLSMLKEQEDDYKNILSDYEDLAREHEKLLDKKIPLITNGQEVVRCKDCVFGKREKNDSTGMTWIYCGHHRENRPEDWFCASGSRIPLQEGR